MEGVLGVVVVLQRRDAGDNAVVLDNTGQGRQTSLVFMKYMASSYWASSVKKMEEAYR